MIIRSLILVTQCLFQLLQPGDRTLNLCSLHFSLRNSKWDLPLQSHPNSCITRKPSFLKGSSSSSPMSHLLPSLFLLTAPRGGVGDSGSQDGKWGLWNGKLRGRRHPRKLPETTLSPVLQMPWLQTSQEKKTLYGFQSAVGKTFKFKSHVLSRCNNHDLLLRKD